MRSAVGKLLAARAADAVAGSSGMQVAIGRVTLRAVGLQAATAAKRAPKPHAFWGGGFIRVPAHFPQSHLTNGQFGEITANKAACE